MSNRRLGALVAALLVASGCESARRDDVAPTDAVASDGSVQRDVPDADVPEPLDGAPFACGSQTCAPNQVCLHLCCGTGDRSTDAAAAPCLPNPPRCEYVGCRDGVCANPTCEDVGNDTCAFSSESRGCEVVEDRHARCACTRWPTWP